MRITNTMLTNTMMININRNMKQVDTLYNQLASGKRIQVPSDDPIRASRALKFRTNVAETKQYQRNVDQGLSWMDVTESACNNVTSLLKLIRDRCEQSANGTNEYEDQQKINADIQQMFQQLGAELNSTYAGRYVFSGYRTDQPMVFEQNEPTLSYTITQVFNKSDIEKCKSYRKLPDPVTGLDTELPEVRDVNILKLPYTDVGDLDGDTITLKGGGTVTIEEVSLNDVSKDPYSPPTAGTAYYIPDTGEIVLHADDAALFDDNTSITYTKANFKKGELNPIVNFTCTDTSSGKSYNMENQNLQYEFSVNTCIDINTLGKNVLTDKLYADLRDLCDLLNTVKTSDADLLRQKYSDSPHNLSGSDLDKAVEDQLTEERSRIAAAVQEKCNSMLKLVDKHMSVVSKEHTDLGSRMNRLTLIQNRLEQDEESYTKLLSENEDVNLADAIMELSIAEAVYQASLRASANVVQMTLANYI